MKREDSTPAILEADMPKCKQCNHYSHGFCEQYDAAVNGNAQACSAYAEKHLESHPSYIKLS